MSKPKHEQAAEQQSATADDLVNEALDQAATQFTDQTPSTSQPTTDERVLAAEREVLRLRAELENFRKRMQRDADLQLKYANLPLLRDLIEVVDNLNRAIEAARSDSSDTGALLAGVEMVSQQLSGVLGKFGCKLVEALGHEFDPNYHEAIAEMPSSEYAAGLVAQEVAVGYVLHDRVVRPSNVVVSSGPPPTNEPL